MSILDECADYAKLRSHQNQKNISLEVLKAQAYALPKGQFEFEKALKKKELAFICEVKKASPSKGIIAEDFDYLQIAQDYEKAGADCISCLTEPKWFYGSDLYLKEIVKTVSIPVLRKDFTVDDYMIYEAKVLGAQAILLICAILSETQIKDYLKIADDLGLSTLVEAHDEKEIEMALRCKARIIGVNNRNLKDFSVNTNNSAQLRNLVSKDILFVSESGISNVEDIKAVKKMGADAVLIGEALMKAPDKTQKLQELKGL